MDNLSQQKRVLIAVLLSCVIFLGWQYFRQNVLKHDQNATTKQALVQKQIKSKPISTKLSLAGVSTKRSELAIVQSKHFRAHIDSLGRIYKFELLDKRYEKDGKPLDLISTSFTPLPLEVRFEDAALNKAAFATAYQVNTPNLSVLPNQANKLVLTQDLNGVKLSKIINFHPDGTYEIKMSLSHDAKFFISPGFRPNIAVDSYTVHGVLLMDTKDKLDVLSDGDVKANENFSNITLAAASDRYYTTFFYNFTKPMDVLVSNSKDDDSLVFVTANKSFEASGYIGAKSHALLSKIDPRLESVIEYGWFTFIAKPMFWFLNFIHNFVGNWGWAIVVLTLIIRLILFPLTYKSMISMNKLKELTPRVKEIKERYKGDSQKINLHTMELYKKHGANPLSGCLPILLQIPIFFAIYRVLLNAIELKGAPWILWIHDLSVQDPYYVLPILMGAAMFGQQLLTPMTIQDPTQQKIMRFLPLVFTLFFVNFPAGLTLYWCVNNICSLLQQAIINQLFKKHKIAIQEEHHKKKLEHKEMEANKAANKAKKKAAKKEN